MVLYRWCGVVYWVDGCVCFALVDFFLSLHKRETNAVSTENVGLERRHGKHGDTLNYRYYVVIISLLYRYSIVFGPIGFSDQNDTFSLRLKP